MKNAWIVLGLSGMYFEDTESYPVAVFTDERKANEWAQLCRENYGDTRYDPVFRQLDKDTEYSVEAVPLDPEES